MPRRRKTNSGAPAQNIGSVPGQRYGEGVAQQEMQRNLPAPDNRTQPLGSRAGQLRASPHTPAAPEQAPGDSLAEIIARAQQGPHAGAGMLSMPTERPDEVVTTGLHTGPGAGPEVMNSGQFGNPHGRFLRELAARTGNPYFSQLADRMGS